VGKWTENIGALASWVLGALLVIVAAIVWGRRGAATTFQLMPSAHWATVSFWATIAYAMTGIEMAGFMAGEMRDPGRDVPRAAWISSAFTTVFYVAATAALLVVLRPDQISELNGLAQVVTSAGITVGASWLAPLTVLLVMATAIGQFGGIGSSVARMPFAAGVDHLFPAVFAKVHPRWNTPYISMFAFGVLASAMLVLVQFGDSMRAAYQTLISLMVIAGFLPYVYMFASAWRAGRKLTAVLGQAMTALAIVCSVAPTEEIGNVWLFEFKIAAGTAAIILSGRLVYRRYSARTNSQWASSAPGR
jgi:glutamate:GABA antiporter